MPQSTPDTLGLSRTFLRFLIPLNIVLGIGIVVLLIASLVAETWVLKALGVKPVTGTPEIITAMRVIMVIGIIAVPLTHRVLSRLLAIVDTVGAGNPFVADNARRLETIAWSVLVLELLHFGVRASANWASSKEFPIDIGGEFSVTRWLAVLLCFVLARVFDQGTRMREDLEGTV